MAERSFGVSTHLFHPSRLTREHLVHIAAHGFDAVEVFATRSHFDYHDHAAIEQLAEWLSDTHLTFHSMHAPIFEGLKGDQWIAPFSTATNDEKRRAATLAETRAALAVATTVPYHFLVVHLGTPSGAPTMAADNHSDAARRSLEEIAAMASETGVRVAVEVIPNSLSTPERLVHLIEEQLDGLDVGICLDYGHANLMGDLAEAIETVSGHLWTTHVHDNRGRTDEHLVPYMGTIDWEIAMMETQKIGYDGVLMLEVAGSGDPVDVLKRSVSARQRLEKTFVTF